MGLVSVEKCNGPIDVVFLVPGSRWGEPREHLYFVINIEQSLHLSQRIQTHVGFWTGQPVHQAVIEHVMTTQQWIVKDFEDGARRIDDCLEFEFEPDERVLSDLSDASGSGIPSYSVSDVLSSSYDGV